MARHEFRWGSRGQIIGSCLVGNGKKFGYFKDKLKTLTVSSDLCSEKIAMITVYPIKTVLFKSCLLQGHHPSAKKGGPSFRKLWKLIGDTPSKHNGNMLLIGQIQVCDSDFS